MPRHVNRRNLALPTLYPRFREPHLGVILPAMYLARVYVTLKPTVNDPPGLTIRGGLHSLGFAHVQSVRSGKYMEIRLDATSRADADGQTAEMCRKLLANPVIEDFRYELEELPVTA
jgi:phosphoribosylformylglycinamidine synthase